MRLFIALIVLTTGFLALLAFNNVVVYEGLGLQNPYKLIWAFLSGYAYGFVAVPAIFKGL